MEDKIIDARKHILHLLFLEVVKVVLRLACM